MDQIPGLVFRKVRPAFVRNLLQEQQLQLFKLPETPKVGEQIQDEVRGQASTFQVAITRVAGDVPFGTSSVWRNSQVPLGAVLKCFPPRSAEHGELAQWSQPHPAVVAPGSCMVVAEATRCPSNQTGGPFGIDDPTAVDPPASIKALHLACQGGPAALLRRLTYCQP